MFWKKKEPEFDFTIPPPFPPSPVAHLRPCLADGKPATFHRWVDADSTLLHINVFARQEERDIINRRFKDTGVVPNCCTADVVRAVFALVEYPDGSVGKVKPELIQFLDRGDVD